MIDRGNGWWLAVAGIVFVLDQVSKAWAMGFLQACPICGQGLTPFFNLTLVSNYGISFGLLASKADAWLFSLIVIVLTGVLIWWTWRTTHGRLFLGAVIGGAIGNLMDRLRLGYVVDFLDFHLAGWHWPAFNVADMAIVGGVIGYVLFDGMRVRRGQA
ncbi:MAG: signal peptidase II [Pseudomonadota bacterium]